MNSVAASLSAMLLLSHDLGREERELAILGEGNTSARAEAGGSPDDVGETFWVKASGSNLATLDETGATLCRFDGLLPLLEDGVGTAPLSDEGIDAALLDSRTDGEAKKPSVEALFHAYLLSLPGVLYVGHTHPTDVNQILCSPRAAEFAERRLFPDQVVCCGASSVLVPYTDPGLGLARAIRAETAIFMASGGQPPRVILLQNHGLIALGRTPQAVLAATLMAAKSARIFLGAAALGGPVFMTEADVARISNRSDEHYRQRALNL